MKVNMLLAGIVPVEIAIGLWLAVALPGLVQVWLGWLAIFAGQ